jgi:hypothetical protein
MRIEKLSKTETAWVDLFNRAPNATPFTSYEWFIVLARNLLKVDPDMMLFYDRNTAVGIIPASVSDHMLTMVGDERVTDLNDMIYMPGYEHLIVKRLAEYVAEDGLRLDLYPLALDSPLVDGLRKCLPDSIVQEKDLCPVLHLPSTWEDYLAFLEKKSRHELRRKMNKVNEARIEDVKPAAKEIFLELMARSDREKKDFLDVDTVAFFRELINTFADKGWLRMRAAALKERTLGMILAFGFKDWVYLFNMGFDPDLRRLSPGIVTIGMDINAAIREGYKHYDFLRGDEDYKYRFGAEKRHTVRITR